MSSMFGVSVLFFSGTTVFPKEGQEPQPEHIKRCEESSERARPSLLTTILADLYARPYLW